MLKSVSINKVRVLNFAGLLVFAACALAFLAFPIVSFAKPNMATVTAGQAFTIALDGTSTKVDSFDPKADAPTDGSLQLVQITPKGGQQILGIFLGKNKVEFIQSGKATPGKIK
jgi:hypothetical protein